MESFDLFDVKDDISLERAEAIRVATSKLQLSAEECAKAFREFARSCNELSINSEE